MTKLSEMLTISVHNSEHIEALITLLGSERTLSKGHNITPVDIAGRTFYVVDFYPEKKFGYPVLSMEGNFKLDD